MRVADFQRVMKIAEWRTLERLDQLVVPDEEMQHLYLIFSGNLAVVRDYHQLKRLEDGQFVGEMAFLTDLPPAAEVIALEHVRYIAWSHEKLRALFKKKPSIASAFQAIIGTDLIWKLRN